MIDRSPRGESDETSLAVRLAASWKVQYPWFDQDLLAQTIDRAIVLALIRRRKYQAAKGRKGTWLSMDWASQKLLRDVSSILARLATRAERPDVRPLIRSIAARCYVEKEIEAEFAGKKRGARPLGLINRQQEISTGRRGRPRALTAVQEREVLLRAYGRKLRRFADAKGLAANFSCDLIPVFKRYAQRDYGPGTQGLRKALEDQPGAFVDTALLRKMGIAVSKGDAVVKKHWLRVRERHSDWVLEMLARRLGVN